MSNNLSSKTFVLFNKYFLTKIVFPLGYWVQSLIFLWPCYCTVTSSLYTCTCIQYYSFNLWDFVWLQITDLTEEIKQLVEKKLRTEDPTDNKSALFKQQVRPCLVLKTILVSTSDRKSCVRRFWMKVNTDQIMTLNIWMLVSFQY